MSEKELEPFLFETPKTKEKSSSSLRIILLLLFSTLGFAALSLYFYLKTLSPPLGTFEKGWKTDFGNFAQDFGRNYANKTLGPAREYVSTKQVQFTGSPAFDADENYFVPHPDPIKYVGEPSEEIDRAWEDITWGMTMEAVPSSSVNLLHIRSLHSHYQGRSNSYSFRPVRRRTAILESKERRLYWGV